MKSWWTRLAAGTGWMVFILAIAWPTAALMVRSLTDGAAPRDGFTYSGRQLVLLWRSVWMSGVAAVACIIVSLPGAFVVGRVGKLSSRPWWTAVLVAALVFPPMVYAFGWERIVPPGFDPYVRCIGVWALWGWPIPALIIGTGWLHMGRQAYEAALLETTPAGAFLCIVLPLLAWRVALAALLIFLLFFGDYAVPHACGLRVFSTELLGWAASSSRTIDTLWPALLSIAVTALALTAVFAAWRHGVAGRDVPAPSPSTRGAGPAAIALVVLTLTWLVPIAALVARLESPAVLAEAWCVYNRDILWSLAVAALSGAIAVGMGLALAVSGRRAKPALLWTVLMGALPGALIGDAMIAAYNHSQLWWLYDYWPIVALSYVSRYGWIGVLTGVVAMRSIDRDLLDQARTDGASSPRMFFQVQLPLCLPTLLAGVALVTARSLADVATSSLVRVPTYAPLGHVLIEKFHRFEDGMLISLSLITVIASLPGVLLVAWHLRRRG